MIPNVNDVYGWYDHVNMKYTIKIVLASGEEKTVAIDLETFKDPNELTIKLLKVRNDILKGDRK